MSKIYNALEYIHSITEEPLMKFDGSEDLAVWQKKARAKLEELLGLPFNKCDDKFVFIESEDSYNGWTIELQPVMNGNLDTDIIDRSEFPN